MSSRQPENEEFVELDENSLEKIRVSIESAKNGRRWSVEEATQYAKERRAQWRKIQKDQTA